MWLRGDIEVPRPSFKDKLVGSLNVNMAYDPEDCISIDEGNGLTFDVLTVLVYGFRGKKSAEYYNHEERH